MAKILRRPVVSVSILLSIALGAFFLHNSFLFAENNKPERGSIQFGAQKQPNIETAPAMEGFANVVADVAEEVVPTVVSVIPTKIDTVVFSNNPFYQFFGDPFSGNPFEEFFGRPRQRRSPPPVERREHRRQGLGSGVIVSDDGYILTNFHVIAGADEIEIKTSDGRSYDAQIVGSDSLTDVAVLKIEDSVEGLPVAYLGDSEQLRPGDWAIAIGNPFSLTSSVTMGIVSATGRTTPGGSGNTYQNFIQTDAAINPGNSGGALVNIRGELIGINTMIYTRSGGNMGIGFAIPINMARRVMEDLIYEGRVTRGWLGVMIQELDQSTREAFGIAEGTRGVLIGDVFDDQPADKAGIKRGDIIVSVNQRAVTEPNQLRNAIANIRPGQEVPVEILRDNKTKTLNVRITERDEQTTRAQRSSSEENEHSSGIEKTLGLSLGNITRDIRRELDLPRNTNGVIVQGVAPNGRAAREGIRENDIIIEVNRNPVQSVDDVEKIANQLQKSDPLLLLIQRDGNTFFRAFRLR
ncbi:DegQ family serine endoprotease [Chitinispirillales bacterium ANBcel5]|uniref:DegQ family serine endoprotease n=1 Tax=Cellulosispirillum alkaliphilum TaxID=3039283 RepID=UPI002A51E7EF|nr:DegQ family serine endoprotease [Chitinispirillales bacterium ANBcel5]